MAYPNTQQISPDIRRAEPMNLTSRAALTMLIVENPNAVMELIRPMLLRYVGNNALSQDEMELCQSWDSWEDGDDEKL